MLCILNDGRYHVVKRFQRRKPVWYTNRFPSIGTMRFPVKLTVPTAPYAAHVSAIFNRGYIPPRCGTWAHGRKSNWSPDREMWYSAPEYHMFRPTHFDGLHFMTYLRDNKTGPMHMLTFYLDKYCTTLFYVNAPFCIRRVWFY